MRPGKSAQSLTNPAMFSAVSLVLLYGASVSPGGTVGLVALAGIPCAGVVVAGGIRSGVLCWVSVSILGFLIISDRFAVLLYATMFGLYPVMKSKFETLPNKRMEIGLKIVFFNTSYTILVWITKIIALQGLPWKWDYLGATYLLGNILFLLYDYGFSKLIAVYLSRIERGTNWRKD